MLSGCRIGSYEDLGHLLVVIPAGAASANLNEIVLLWDVVGESFFVQWHHHCDV